MDQLENTNHTRTENVSLSAITIRSEELVIIRAHLDDTLIHTNQVSASIDRQVHGDQEFSFGSWKSCDKMGINFGRKKNNVTSMKPSRTIGNISPHITSL